MEIKDIVAFEYAQTSARINQLKQQAKVQIGVKSAHIYHSPDKTQVKLHITESDRQAGWKFGYLTYPVMGHMNPKSELWREYCWTRARARLINCAVLVLKRDGNLTSQARLVSQQRRLAKRAKNYLKKIENRLDKYPTQYANVDTWLSERNVQRAARAA